MCLCAYVLVLCRCLFLFPAAVMGTEGFNYLEETFPSLLSDLLATVAVLDDDPASVNRKRGVCGNEGATPVESVEASERRTRRRV